MKTTFYGNLDHLVELALAEDVGTGDLATSALIGQTTQGKATLVAKADGILSGLWVAERVFRHLDPRANMHCERLDGESVCKGETFATIHARYDALLTGERVALNFLQRMSGIATLTHRYVEQLAGLPTRLLDTRKTVPGLRALDKRAVLDGGGSNHRMGLFDLAMIKDNHIAMAGGITQAVQAVRAAIPAYTRIEVETTTLAEVEEALNAQVEIIMLDNMPLDMMREAVQRISGRAMTEASGNVTVESIRSIAETGVDFVSVGALTHSVRALDISMRIIPVA